jgi:signal transduction histidine kinase
VSRQPLPRAYHRLAVGGRLWALLILAVPAVVLGDGEAARWLVGVGAVWLAVTLVEIYWPRHGSISLLDAALIGMIAGVTVDDRLPMLVALALPPFTGGLRFGVRGVARALSTELSILVVTALAAAGAIPVSQASTTLTSTLTGLGLGLIASYVHADLHKPQDPLAPYRDAQRLLRGLIDLSGTLGSGLDAVALGSRVAVALRNEFPVQAAAVHVARQDELTPLVSTASSFDVDESPMDGVALGAWRTQALTVSGQAFAFPLVTELGVVAVVSGLLADRLDPRQLLTSERLDQLTRSLAATAVHLDTALLFSKLRDAATADERRRLSREMHDGIAQDIASLGYLVDALAAAPASPQQAERLETLRARITAVVAEVRRSLQTLRSDAEASESLGAAISSIARHLSESADVPIRVTVSEQTRRLRPEVESELLRITQEAMTNAVRHSGASTIEVDCRVSAPAAEIVVRDDGHGMGRGRDDSHGLVIMRERATLVDAELAIEPGDRAGTVVTVRVPSRSGSSTPPVPVTERAAL